VTSFTFLLQAGVWPFTASLSLVVVLAILEFMTYVAGLGGITHAFEHAFGVDLDGDFDMAHPDFSHGGVFVKAVNWARVGELPLSILLITWWFLFGIVGVGAQYASSIVLGGATMPFWIVVWPVMAVSIGAYRGCARIFVRVLPTDVETYAVEPSSFVGRTATVVMGTATVTAPAQARLVDQYGNAHYVMVEPSDPEQAFAPGATVLLVEQNDAVFRVINPPSALLLGT